MRTNYTRQGDKAFAHNLTRGNTFLEAVLLCSLGSLLLLHKNTHTTTYDRFLCILYNEMHSLWSIMIITFFLQPKLGYTSVESTKYCSTNELLQDILRVDNILIGL